MKKFKCPQCKGDGWIAEPTPIEYPDGEYEWEERQVTCPTCEGRGFINIGLSKSKETKNKEVGK